MKFTQVEKTKEYIYSHLDEDLHLIKCVRVPVRGYLDGRVSESYTSFQTKMLRKMSDDEIEEAVNDENTVLIKIEMEES